MADGARASGRQGQQGATASAPGKLRVFISYSRDDLAFADQLVAGLDLCGFEPTLDRHGISGGEAWERRLGALIREADTVVFVLSPASAASKVCAWEVGEATRLNKRIIPVLALPLAGTSPPPALRELNYIFFYADPAMPGSGFGSGLARLVAALNTDLDWLREHTRLLQRATEWDVAGRPVNRLLSGSDILDAKDWTARRPVNAPEPTGLHLDFIRASESEEADRASAQRKQLEAITAAQAEREKALALAEDATRKRARLRAGAFIALAAVAIFAGWQWWDAGRANIVVAEQRDLAVRFRTEADYGRASAEAAARRADEASKRAHETALRLVARQLNKEGDHIAAATIALDVHHQTEGPALKALASEVAFILDGALRGMRERRVFAGHNRSVRSAQFSGDSKSVLTASYDGTLRIFDIASGKGRALASVEKAEFGRAFPLAGGQRVGALYSHENDYFAAIWDIHDDRPRLRVKLANTNYGAVRFLEDGAGIVVRDSDQDRGDQVRLWQVDGGSSLLLGTKGYISPDGERYIRPRDDGRVDLVGTRNGAIIATIGDGEQLFERAEFDEAGRWAAIVWGKQRDLVVVDSKTGQVRRKLVSPSTFDRVTISADGSRLVNSFERPTGELTVLGIETWNLHDSAPLATATIDQILSARGPKIGRFRPHSHLANLSPDGRLLLIAGWDNFISVRDTATGAMLWRLPGDTESFPPPAFTADSTILATVHSDERVRIWRARAGERVGTLVGHEDRIVSIRFSSDDTQILTSSADGTARQWSVEPVLQHEVIRVPTPPPKAGDLPHLPPSLGIESDRGHISRVVFNRQGTRLLASDNGGRTFLVDPQSKLLIAAFENGSQSYETGGMDFNSAGDRFFLIHHSGRLVIYESATGAALTTIAQAEAIDDRLMEFSEAFFLSDGLQILTLSRPLEEPIRIKIWNTDTGKQVATLDGSELGRYHHISIDPTGRLFAMHGVDGKYAVIFDTGTWRPIRRFDHRSGRLIWSRDGRRLALEGAIFEVETGKLLVEAKDRADCGAIIDWSEDTNRLVSVIGSNSITMCIHDTTTGALVARIDGDTPSNHNREIGGAWLVAGGTRVLTSSADNSAKLWDADTGALVATLGTPIRPMEGRIENARGVLPVAVSRDRRHIATGHYDKTARIWDAATGQPLAILEGHSTGIGSLEFDFAGGRLATGAFDETVRIWPTIGSSEAIIAKAIEALPRCLFGPARVAIVLHADLPDWCFEHVKWPAPPVRVGISIDAKPGEPGGEKAISPPLRGVRISRVMKGLPGDKAGLRAGDVILAVAGADVHFMTDVLRRIAELPSDRSATFKVLRGATAIEALVTPRF